MKISAQFKNYIRNILILLVFSFHYAFADDTAFGGEGAAPMPIEQTNVKMLAEKIVITGFNIVNPQGYWKYDCLYHFQNMTATSLHFLMGFPFPTYNEYEQTATPAGIKLNPGNPLVYQFKAAINGKSIAVQHTLLAANVSKNLDYRDAYQWPVSFAPNQVLTITHQYLTGVTANDIGETWVQFVLRTGGLWQSGTIGKVQIRIIPNIPTRLCSEVYKTSPEDRSIYQTPIGLSVVQHGKLQDYVWNLNNLHPTKDVNLCLLTGPDYVSIQLSTVINYGGNRTASLEKYSCAHLRLLRNLTYAQYGKIFNNKTLQNYFSQQWWYQANTNYTDQNLSEIDKQIIAIILKVEAAKQCEEN